MRACARTYLIYIYIAMLRRCPLQSAWRQSKVLNHSKTAVFFVLFTQNAIKTGFFLKILLSFDNIVLILRRCTYKYCKRRY